MAAIDGSLTNQGFLHVAPGDTDGTLDVNGKLTNYGYMTLGASGALNITGTLTNQAPGETVFPQVEAGGPITVYGILENSNVIYLGATARLLVQTGGQYAGSGDLAVYADTAEDVETFVSGLDMTGFSSEEVTDDSGHYWVLRKDTTTTVNTELNSIPSDANAEEVKAAVQDINTEELKAAMVADSDTVAKLAELEKQVGTNVVVEVTDNASAFDQGEVTIVGAGLNTAQTPDEDIKLVVGAPAEEHTLDSQYDSSAAVPFSMTLENVTDTDDLAVPVKITLPVPEGINSELLVILHYHAGIVETVSFTLSQDGTQVSFVLTGFSDFVMTQSKQASTGDVNCDGKLDINDVRYLAMHITAPEVFPIPWESGDVNGDGVLDINDVRYLAMHITSPTVFPLFPNG